jgi:hypothetical protein
MGRITVVSTRKLAENPDTDGHAVFAEPDHKAKFVQDVIDFVKEGNKPGAEGEVQSKL